MSYSGIDEAESIPFSELPKRYFKNLPRLQTIFVGRESEVKQVTEFLEFGSDIHIVGILVDLVLASPLLLFMFVIS